MYLERFQLKEFPFRLTPDPSFLYLSEQHAKAKNYMESTLLLADGFVVITGEIGSGKTTLIESFLSGLDDNVVTARIHQTQITPTEFLQAVLVEFGFQPFDMDKPQLTKMLNEYLLEQYAKERKIVLIVDEAQNLTHSVLEELRLISGLETTKEKVLSIILAGQPEFNDTLNSPRLAQLAQRTRLRFHIGALTLEETKKYISHRLKIAGAGRKKLIKDNAIAPIHYFTGGIPRLINTLCDTAFVVAYQKQANAIDEAIIKETADELNWESRTFPIGMSPEARHPKLRDEAKQEENEGFALLREQVKSQQELIKTLQTDITDRLSKLDNLGAAQPTDNPEQKLALKKAREKLVEKGQQIKHLDQKLQTKSAELESLHALRAKDAKTIEEQKGQISQLDQLVDNLRLGLSESQNRISSLEEQLQPHQELIKVNKAQEDKLHDLSIQLKEQSNLSKDQSAEIKQYRSNIERLDAEVAKKENHKQQQEQRILQLSDHIAELKTRVAEREQDIKTLQSYLDDERQSNDQLNAQLETSGGVIQTHQQNLDDRASELSQLSRQLVTRNEQISALEEDLEKLKTGRVNLQSRIDESHQESALLRQVIKEREKTIAELENALNSQAEHLQSGHGEIQALKERINTGQEQLNQEVSKNQELAQTLGSEQKHIAQLNEALSKREKEIRWLENKLEEQRSKFSSIDQTLGDKLDALASLQQQLEERDQTIGQRDQQIQQLQQNVDTSQATTDSLSTQLKDIEEQNQELMKQQSQWEEKEKTADSKLQSQENKVATLENSLKESEQKVADLKNQGISKIDELKILQKSLEDANRQAEIAKKKEKEHQSKVKRKTKQISQLNQDIARLEKIWDSVQTWESSIESYKSEIRVKSRIIDNLRDELQTLQTERVNLEDQSERIESLETALKDQQTQRETLEETLKGNKESVEALTKEAIEHRQKISEAEEELGRREKTIQALERDLQDSSAFVDSLREEINTADFTRKIDHVDTVRLRRPVEPHLPPAKLLISNDGVYNTEFPLDSQRVVIGRSSDNDIRVQSEFVSRHHAQIISTPFSSVIEDLNSSNGIFVNSKRVKKHRLKHRDIIRIGKHTLIYINEAQSGNAKEHMENVN